MKPAPESQGTVDLDQIFLRIRRLSITQRYLARRLHRTKSSISYALSGKRKKLLGRILRHLDYLEERSAAIYKNRNEVR
jgi:hypothetical protein